MKSAFEIAMARLEKEAPAQSLSDQQKKELADLDNLYEAKKAERKIFLEGKIQGAIGTTEEEGLRRQLQSELARLGEELESKKARVRKS